MIEDEAFEHWCERDAFKIEIGEAIDCAGFEVELESLLLKAALDLVDIDDDKCWFDRDYKLFNPANITLNSVGAHIRDIVAVNLNAVRSDTTIVAYALSFNGCEIGSVEELKVTSAGRARGLLEG